MAEQDQDEVLDSPTGWVAKHIRHYVETGGKNGGVYYGVPALLLTTRGRTSGRLRRTAVYYGTDGDRHVVIPSNGGADDHPAWYLNLVAEPRAQVQVGEETFEVRARVATEQEKPALWAMMAGLFPQYDVYQAKAARDIPVVILERA